MDATPILGRYRFISRLGAGGSSTVVLAEDTLLGRQVALKRIHAPDDIAARSRLRREALIGASLGHPNLVSIFDIATTEDGEDVIVMEYVEGETLADRLRKGKKPELGEALAILSGVSSALDAIHRRGIVHRDVKPANILLGSEGAVKLADLGIAAVSDGTRITSQESVLGTFRYMAPEQLEGAQATPAVDVYELAAVAYEALTGEKARHEPNPLALAHAIATQPPPDLRTVWPQAPAAAAQILTRGMSRDPKQRPRSAGELTSRLREALRPHTTEAAAVDPGSDDEPGGRQQPARAGVVVGAVTATSLDPAAGAASPRRLAPRAAPAPVAGAVSPRRPAPLAAPRPAPAAAAAAASPTCQTGSGAASDAPAREKVAAADRPERRGPADRANRRDPARNPAHDRVAAVNDRAPAAVADPPHSRGPAEAERPRRRPPAALLAAAAMLLAAGAIAAIVLAGWGTPGRTVAGVNVHRHVTSPSTHSKSAKARVSSTTSSGSHSTGSASSGSASSGSASTGSGSAAPASTGSTSTGSGTAGSGAFGSGAVGSATSGSGSSPIAAVESFYHLAAAHDYPAAWALADPAFRQQMQGYQGLEGTMAQERSITFDGATVLNQSANAATVAIRTISVRSQGSQHCSGTVALVRSTGAAPAWLLDHISINCV